MTRSRRRTRVIVCALAVVPIAVGTLALRALAANPSSGEAARLVEQMRDAPLQHDFAGAVTVTWHSGGKTRHATVDVRGDQGSVEVASGSRRVVDDEGSTYVLGGAGSWSSVLALPPPSDLPAPDHTWTLTSRTGPSVAGRPTTIVEALRRSGTAALRLYLDTQTGLLLEREVLDTQGRVLRSLAFTSIAIGTPPAPIDEPPVASNRQAPTLASIPAGYHAPSEIGGNYELVGKVKRPGGGIVLTYSDGMFSASVTEQKGELDWGSLPAGGTDATIADHEVRKYSTSGGDVIIWERDGVVYTCVTDVPADVLGAMVGGLGPSSRSTVDQAVDFVLGPFGWN
jgi:sigma-E factor negative regulatory protein RseB